MIDLLYKKIKELYADSTAPQDLPILKATWDYPTDNLVGTRDFYRVSHFASPEIWHFRLQTLKVNGKDVEVIWMPYNWGYKGLSTAASTNLLTIDAGDPNTWILETKACLINIEKA